MSCICPLRPTKTISSSSSESVARGNWASMRDVRSAQLVTNLRTSSSSAWRRPLAALAFLSFSRSSLGTLPCLRLDASPRCFAASRLCFSAACRVARLASQSGAR